MGARYTECDHEVRPVSVAHGSAGYRKAAQ